MCFAVFSKDSPVNEWECMNKQLENWLKKAYELTVSCVLYFAQFEMNENMGCGLFSLRLNQSVSVGSSNQEPQQAEITLKLLKWRQCTLHLSCQCVLAVQFSSFLWWLEGHGDLRIKEMEVLPLFHVVGPALLLPSSPASSSDVAMHDGLAMPLLAVKFHCWCVCETGGQAKPISDPIVWSVSVIMLLMYWQPWHRPPPWPSGKVSAVTVGDLGIKPCFPSQVGQGWLQNWYFSGYLAKCLAL